VQKVLKEISSLAYSVNQYQLILSPSRSERDKRKGRFCAHKNQALSLSCFTSLQEIYSLSMVQKTSCFFALKNYRTIDIRKVKLLSLPQ